MMLQIVCVLRCAIPPFSGRLITKSLNQFRDAAVNGARADVGSFKRCDTPPDKVPVLGCSGTQHQGVQGRAGAPRTTRTTQPADRRPARCDLRAGSSFPAPHYP